MAGLLGFSATPGRAVPGQAEPGFGGGSGATPSPPGNWSYYSSVPGMFVPGMAQPGRDGRFASQVLYLYIGQMACFYLDYLDLATGRTLAPVPGNYYTMLVANPRKGLTVPPPGRPWVPGNAGAGGTFAPLVVRRLISWPPLAVSHGHYAGAACAHCDPVSRLKGLPPLTTGRASPQPPLAVARAALERQRNTTGWHDRRPAPQPEPAAAIAAPPPPPGPTVMQQARASLEESRAAHGHYAPGGCKRCLSGG